MALLTLAIAPLALLAPDPANAADCQSSGAAKREDVVNQHANTVLQNSNQGVIQQMRQCHNTSVTSILNIGITGALAEGIGAIQEMITTLCDEYEDMLAQFPEVASLAKTLGYDLSGDGLTKQLGQILQKQMSGALGQLPQLNMPNVSQQGFNNVVCKSFPSLCK